MNQKQKLGYTALGAVIMLVGIGIGSIVSPPLIAQRDGVFGEIECTKLTVVDNAGKPSIVLNVGKEKNVVAIFDNAGKPAVSLFAGEEGGEEGHGVVIFSKTGEAAIALAATEDGNRVVIVDKAGGKTAIGLAATEDGNHAVVLDKLGEIQWSTWAD